MNKIKLNINNLTRLWKMAGETFENYFEDEAIFWSQIKNSEWPNRVWTNKPLTEETILKIKSRMRIESGLTFSYFSEIKKRNLLMNDNDFKFKSLQSGMSLPLTNKFSTQKQIDFKEVTGKTDAKLWSESFYEAFNYNISTETVLRTKNDIQYFLSYHESELVGTIVLFVTEKVAGIHSLGILPAKRKQGLATDIMHAILNTAIDQDLTLATLQASEMAKEMYLKMGFSFDFLMENFQLKH
ncbi:MAG: GNAT family N-acetyltransferase [Dysgonomonas sp.]